MGSTPAAKVALAFAIIVAILAGVFLAGLAYLLFLRLAQSHAQRRADKGLPLMRYHAFLEPKLTKRDLVNSFTFYQENEKAIKVVAKNPKTRKFLFKVWKSRKANPTSLA